MIIPWLTFLYLVSFLGKPEDHARRDDKGPLLIIFHSGQTARTLEMRRYAQ